MSEPVVEAAEPEVEVPPQRRKKRWRVLGALIVLLLGGLLYGWFVREQLADTVIAGQMQDLGLPGTWTVESVGPGTQIISNIVIGDPKRPDLTVKRAIVETTLRFGLPTIDKVTLEEARLYGSYRGGTLSFGALDSVIFAKRDGQKGLPDLNLALVDGRARVETDWGVIGAKAEGSGNLKSGFAGTLAVAGPQLAFGGCKAERASAFGKVTTASGRARFDGPMRLQSLRCPGQTLALGTSTVQLAVELNETFDAAKGTYALNTAALGWQGYRAGKTEGKGDFAFAAGDIVASYSLTGSAVDLGGAGAGTLVLDGTLRSEDQLSRFNGEGTINGRNLKGGKALIETLAGLETSGEGTLLAPLAKQIRAALAREERGSSLRADYTLRQTGGITQVTLPFAELRGGTGARLLGLSKVAVALGMRGGPRFSGRFVTGGAGLPQMEGVAERKGGGMTARFSLAEYRAGSSSVALPDLRLEQLPSGQIGFAGRALVSGPLPGGEVRGLQMPVQGNWSENGGLAVWRQCTPVSFDRLKVGNLALAGRGLVLCPGSQGAILISDARGIRLAAGTTGLNLAGTLGTTPIRLRSGVVGFAYPGKLVAKAIDVSIGPLAKPSTLKVALFSGELGKAVTGRFSGTELKLFAVPLDMSEVEGDLRFANNELDITGASLKVTDRTKPAKFEPMIARDGALQLRSTTFTAQAVLREPKSDREIVHTSIEHDLDTGVGFADLKVPGILFDDKLQPTMLTYAAQGVIALAKGIVSGTGRIDWNERNLTSTGRFSTDGLDFAAAFGPVKGTRGTVVFTDLLGLVTAPDQRLTLATINPGIEVHDGELSFQLEPDRVLAVNGAKWPFIDGTLELLPTRMVLGGAEVRRFTMKVTGANMAKFVNQLELSNISASGIFDGTLPLVFDEEGGRIEGGLLVSRPPGGNVSYVGELTYKDLSAMGNYAFQVLRSLDYVRMEIGLDGQIDGDILTTFRIAGVRQGPGSKRNFITRQLGKLPVQFNINIRAPFYSLVTSFKSMYDPTYVRDPRSLGLIDADGKPRDPAAPMPEPNPAPTPATPVTLPPAQPPQPKNDDIQDSDSRTTP